MQITSINGVLVIKTSMKEYDEKYGAGMGMNVMVQSGGFMATHYDVTTLGKMEAAGIAVPKMDRDIIGVMCGHGAVIYLEEACEGLSSEELKAVLLHEEAHVRLGHMEAFAATGGSGVMMDLESEMEADAYSASVVGKKVMASALTKVVINLTKRVGVDCTRGLLHPDMRARFSALQ